MPRPGPRPYECVRRAWHSERHQPVRGSIIQQIFRVVNETHSAATKNNKEWQEKLPIVVLKAEEIMYSKANSEVEYMNLDTLWDRVNDAINTIIRRDENTETGELLPPCIEAALNLGCIPVRASRSQRHSNARSYLNPRAQESISMPPRVLDRTNDERCPQLSRVHSGNQMNFSRTATIVNSTLPVSDSNCHLTESSNVTTSRNHPFLCENTTIPGCNRLMAMETNNSMNLGSVYPLYYGIHFQTEDSQLGSRVPENADTNTIFVGKPINTSVSEPAGMGVSQSLITCPGRELACKGISQVHFRDSNEKPPEAECDLSLRLGLFSDSRMSMGRGLIREYEDVGSSCSHDRSKSSDLSPPVNKEFCFLPRKADNDPFEPCSSKWLSESEGRNLG